MTKQQRAYDAHMDRKMRKAWAICRVDEGGSRYQWSPSAKRGSKPPRRMITRRSHEAGVAEIRAAFVLADKGKRTEVHKDIRAYARGIESWPRIRQEDSRNGCKVKRRMNRGAIIGPKSS